MAREQFHDEERAIWSDVKAHLRGGVAPPDDDTWNDRNTPPTWEPPDTDPIGF
jgi:hypothetical protein